MTGTLGVLRRVGLVVLFLAVASVPAFGQNIPGSVEITGVAGGYFGGQIYQNLHTQVDAGTAVEYGARLGYNLTEGVGIEGSWTYSNPSLDATRILPDGLTGTIGTLRTNVYELDGLFPSGRTSRASTSSSGSARRASSRRSLPSRRKPPRI
jgi:hypothetical protein